ncbi:unnamed protein product [Prunus armeniaca]
MLGEVLLANSSSLTSYKDQSVSLKCSNNQFRNEKKPLICERETLQCQDSKVFGFPGKNEKRDEELITPCSAKSSSAQNAQVGSSLLGKDKRVIQQGDAEFLSNKNKSAISIPVLFGDKETKGSEFLVQVSILMILVRSLQWAEGGHEVDEESEEDDTEFLDSVYEQMDYLRAPILILRTTNYTKNPLRMQSDSFANVRDIL